MYSHSHVLTFTPTLPVEGGWILQLSGGTTGAGRMQVPSQGTQRESEAPIFQPRREVAARVAEQGAGQGQDGA